MAITWSPMSLTRVHHFSVSLDGFATGADQSFDAPVFVLTHHPRPPLEMKGGTTFHFIDASPEDSLEGFEADYDIETVTSSASPVTHLTFQRRT